MAAVMLFLSLLLAALAGLAAFAYRRDILHPAFWTHLGFVGYGVGGLYYATFGYQGAGFFDLADISDIHLREELILESMLVVAATWVSCAIGFVFADIIFRGGGWRPIGVTLHPAVTLAKESAVVMVLLGSLYWVYFANAVAGGVVGLFSNVAAYNHLVTEAGITALPLNLVFAGSLLWLLAHLSSPRPRRVALIFLPLAAVIILSRGRITQAVLFPFAGLLLFLWVKHGAVRAKTFVRLALVLTPAVIAFFFYRQFTSYRIIGHADDFALATGGDGSLYETLSIALREIDYVLGEIIGGGNIPDLQQIALIIRGLDTGQMLQTNGSTYFDWAITLVSENTTSTGVRILQAFFPEKVGAPVPGMIGEAVLNFAWVAPVAVGAMCFVAAGLFRSAQSSPHLLAKFVYVQFLVGVWAVMIKVDSSLVAGFLWNVTPVILCWIALKLIAAAVAKSDLAGQQK